MKRAALAAVVVAAVVALGLVVHAAVSSGQTAEAAPTSAMPTTATSTATSTTPEAEQTAQFLPKPEDFTTTVRPLVMTCGLNIRPAPELADQRVAHCKITYRTAVTYHGKPLDPSVTYIVRYEVMGTVNGSEPYSFTISGTHVTGVPVRTAVSSPGAKLAAVANEVEWVP